MLPVSVHGRGLGWFFLVFFVLVKLLSFRATAPPLCGLGFKMKKNPGWRNANRGCGVDIGDKKASQLSACFHRGWVLVGNGLKVATTTTTSTTFRKVSQ